MERGTGRLGVIGLGLIGGSAAIRLKERGAFQRVLGCDNNPLNSQIALELGVIDEIEKLKSIFRTDLIFSASSQKTKKYMLLFMQI